MYYYLLLLRRRHGWFLSGSNPVWLVSCESWTFSKQDWRVFCIRPSLQNSPSKYLHCVIGSVGSAPEKGDISVGQIWDKRHEAAFHQIWEYSFPVPCWSLAIAIAFWLLQYDRAAHLIYTYKELPLPIRHLMFRRESFLTFPLSIPICPMPLSHNHVHGQPAQQAEVCRDQL